LTPPPQNYGFRDSSFCSFSTVPSVRSLARTELHFKETTLQLLCPNTFPVGSLDDASWNDALETIQFWARKVRKSKRGLEAAFQLLDRLVMELDMGGDDSDSAANREGLQQQHHSNNNNNNSNKATNAILTESLNQLVDAWRIAWNVSMKNASNEETITTTSTLIEEHDDEKDSNIPTPLEMMDRLLRYELRLQPLQPNIRTFNMILHAVANSKRHALPGNEDDPAVIAESMLDRLLIKQQDEDNHHTTDLNPSDLHAADLHPTNLKGDMSDVLDWSTTRHHSRHVSIRPNTVTFNTVIHAWAQSDHPEAPLKAEAVLRRMQQQQNQSDGTILAVPNVITYNSVLTAWVNSSSRHRQYHLLQAEQTIPQRCEELWREMKDEKQLKPNQTTYFLLLKAWADAAKHNEQAPERAHSILRQLLELYDPSSSTTSTTATEPLLNVQTDMIDATSTTMNDTNDDGYNMDEQELHYPLSRCYTMVISAYASRGQADQAEELLYDLCRRYNETKNTDFFPDVTCFNAVLDAWAKQGGGDVAARRAEAILQSIQRFSKEHGAMQLRPNVISFTCVLDAWARSRSKEAPERCQEILNQMQRLHQQGLADSKPDVRAYHVVIDCWAKSHKADAPEKAERLVLQMYRMANSGEDPDLKPDMACYNSVLNAWARHENRSEAADQAQSFFEKIISTYEKSRESGDNDPRLKPTLQTYTTLLAAWSRSTRPDGPEKAQAAYDDMVRRYMEGEVHLCPDVIVFNALLDAWAKAGKGHRAELLLNEMLEQVSQQQKQSKHDSTTNAPAPAATSSSSNRKVVIVPNARSFATVINAWSKSGKPDAAERAEGLLRKLQQLTSDGGLLAGRGAEYQPNIYCYNSTLQAWAKNSNPNAVERAAALMAEMVELNDANKKKHAATGASTTTQAAASVAPSTYSYTFYLQAVEKSNLSNKEQHVREVMNHMKEQGVKVDAPILRLVEKCTSSTTEATANTHAPRTRTPASRRPGTATLSAARPSRRPSSASDRPKVTTAQAAARHSVRPPRAASPRKKS
jgi:pentatricopeptide repeat protein